ncbi:MAG: peptide deformylase [Endomicrobium sp.]|jgi:peptide deformylase|nr:peptide deformylase [Endomicrobium sp.]
MSKLDIKKYGNSILRKKSSIVYEVTDNIKKLVNDMFETMYAAPGVGLAAPQIGILARICVVDISKEQNSSFVMINPKILLGENKTFEEEGCLSLPGFFASIRRFNKIIVEYMDLDNKKKEIEVQGFLARAVQHEIDHLDAKIFIDYLPEFKRKSIEKEIKRKKKVGNW